MALKKILLKSSAEDAHRRLDQFLAERLPEALAQPLSKAKVRKLIVAGAVYLNGKRVRIASKELIPGARIETYVDLNKLYADERSKDRAFEMGPERILYEDDYLIIVDKPAGLPTQPTLDEARDNLFAALKRFMSQREGQGVESYLALHHRLDRDTSGVVLFAKKREVNAKVAELFSEHLAQKTYLALTHHRRGGQKLFPQWSIENRLGKDKTSGKRARFTAVRSGGDYAKTDFILLEDFPGGSLIEAKPITGRTHQIRVHLSEYGMPILGDSFYGAQDGSASRVMLHASRLTFPHPVNKVEISVQSPLPEDFLQCLQAIKNRSR